LALVARAFQEIPKVLTALILPFHLSHLLVAVAADVVFNHRDLLAPWAIVVAQAVAVAAEILVGHLLVVVETHQAHLHHKVTTAALEQIPAHTAVAVVVHLLLANRPSQTLVAATAALELHQAFLAFP
jgi:hypothetical protein